MSRKGVQFVLIPVYFLPDVTYYLVDWLLRRISSLPYQHYRPGNMLNSGAVKMGWTGHQVVWKGL